MKIDPLSDVVVIKRDEITESEGGIVIPDNADFREDIGIVRYVGPGKVTPKGETIPMEVKPGDRVLFSTSGYQVTKVNNEELIVTRQNSIIGVISG